MTTEVQILQANKADKAHQVRELQRIVEEANQKTNTLQRQLDKVKEESSRWKCRADQWKHQPSKRAKTSATVEEDIGPSGRDSQRKSRYSSP